MTKYALDIIEAKALIADFGFDGTYIKRKETEVSGRRPTLVETKYIAPMVVLPASQYAEAVFPGQAILFANKLVLMANTEEFEVSQRDLILANGVTYRIQAFSGLTVDGPAIYYTILVAQ